MHPRPRTSIGSQPTRTPPRDDARDRLAAVARPPVLTSAIRGAATSASEVVRDRAVLITGGTGFLGSAVVRRVIASRARMVRVLSVSEARRADLASALRGLPVPIEFVTGDIADPFVVRRAVDGVQVILHLAAMKHVVLAEAQPYEAVKTNVIGTKVLLEAALTEPRLERFIAVSSDKSANPYGVYGMTKALMERIVCEAQTSRGPLFGAVRCGNFWGGAGSVVPIWLRSVREGRPLEVTDPTMTRFVLLSDEAVDLVLDAAARDLRGEILARRMNAYVLGDLAAVFQERFGVEIREVGPRPYEKQHEDLISAVESPFARLEDDDFVLTPSRLQAGAGPFSSRDAVPLSRKRLGELLLDQEITPD